MTRLMVGLSLGLLVVAGCSDNPSAPTSSVTDVSSTRAGSPEAQPIPPASPAPPLWTVSGPTGLDGVCVDRQAIVAMPHGEMVWEVSVRDAGERGITRFVTMTHHDDTPGCAPTQTNPRDRVRQFAGKATYAPHDRGTTSFAFPTGEWTCGRSQVDIAADDGVSQTLLVGLVLNYGRACDPPPPTSECAPTHTIMSAPVTWAYDQTRARIAVTFTVSPALTKPVKLAFASYAILPGAVKPRPGTPPLPQRLVSHSSGSYRAGTYTVTMAVPAGGGIQADLLSCDEPTEDLTVANFEYWNARTISWWLSPDVAGR